MNNDSAISIQTKEDLSTIHRNGNVVSAMIDKLIDFARIQQNDVNINCKIIDMHRVLDKVLNQLKINFEYQKISIEIVKGEIPQIKGDETALYKAVFYVIENAYIFNFNKENKQIKVKTGIKDDKYIYIIISDNGIGISKEELPKIFAPLYAGQAVIDRKVKGLGTGLYISKNLIELLDGKIKVESQINEGTNVEINFPIL
ncbi:MAG: HAMP domain-containing histidine kinase [Calditrichia bacterium]|nr:HAMP domain-containing histidine kinase [Calditrichia bacterium]